jgi:NodT family efflux transporter outer membrane factor (OMF) lipoprotein
MRKHTSPVPMLPARLALCAVLGLGGCAAGPNFHAPAAPQNAGLAPILPDRTVGADIRGGEAQVFVQGADVPAQWWALYQSPAINALVEQALKANPDLAAAKAALKAARENDYAQRGAYLPAIGLEATTTRAKTSQALSPVLSSNSQVYSLQTAQLNVAYTLDVFGGLRRQNESTHAQAEQQQFQTEAAFLTLSSNVVAASIQEAALRDQVAATRDLATLNQEALVILRKQRELGQVGPADVAVQAALLAQSQQALTPLEKQLSQQRDMLAALLGRYPNQTPQERVELDEITLPQSLPLSLPSALVRQRPDIRAAEANMHAASAQVGVAIANRLPNVTLGAVAGGAATGWSQLFNNGNGAWSYSADLLQPVFQGGALMHRQRAAEALFDQAQQQYRSTVIAAFQNVADSLEALQTDARALQAAADSQRSAQQALDIARTQLRLGQIDRLSVILAEQTFQQAHIGVLQDQASRLADTAALIQALGGGWWNRPV